MLRVLQKVKIIDDRLIFIKLSRKTAFLYIETVFFRQQACFYSYLYIEDNKKKHIRIIVMLLKLDTSGSAIIKSFISKQNRHLRLFIYSFFFFPFRNIYIPLFFSSTVLNILMHSPDESSYFNK